MNEIKGAPEIKEISSPESENYKKILPENGTTPGEAKFILDNVFGKENEYSLPKEEGAEVEKQHIPHTEVHNGDVYYYDDNGELYRVGKELAPNNEYEINGYKYKTDELGRIVSVEGTLHIKKRDDRLQIKDSLDDIGKGDQQEGDDRGHLIGDQFDGSNGLENMIPQNSHINRNDFRIHENELAKAVTSGKDVKVKIEPVYNEKSHRPDAIVMTYSIDSKESIRIFPNKEEA